jgi:hypothetical protein
MGTPWTEMVVQLAMALDADFALIRQQVLVLNAGQVKTRQ